MIMEENVDNLDVEVKESAIKKTIEKAKQAGKLVLEEEDFVLIALTDLGYLYDLYLLKTIKPKGKPEREELKLEGYGVSIDFAIRAIAISRVQRGFKGEGIDLGKFLYEFKTCVNDLKKLCPISSITK